MVSISCILGMLTKFGLDCLGTVGRVEGQTKQNEFHYNINGIDSSQSQPKPCCLHGPPLVSNNHKVVLREGMLNVMAWLKCGKKNPALHADFLLASVSCNYKLVQIA